MQRSELDVTRSTAQQRQWHNAEAARRRPRRSAARGAADQSPDELVFLGIDRLGRDAHLAGHLLYGQAATKVETEEDAVLVRAFGEDSDKVLEPLAPE